MRRRTTPHPLPAPTRYGLLFSLAAAVVVGAGAPSHAGPLLRATLSSGFFEESFRGGGFAPLEIEAEGATGRLDASGTFTLDAGSAFAVSQDIPATASVLPVSFAMTRLRLQGGPNGALVGNTRAPNEPIGITGQGIRVDGTAFGDPFGATGVTYGRVELSFGGNVPRAEPPFEVLVGGIVRLGTVELSVVEPDRWHLGTRTVTGLFGGYTSLPFPFPNVTAQGGVSTTAQGNTVITLVTLQKTRFSIVGTYVPDRTYVRASPAFLTLVYAPDPVPESGVAMLLLAGVGLVAASSERRAK